MRSPEFLMCKGLIFNKRWVCNFVIAFVIWCGVLLILEIIGCIRVFGLCVTDIICIQKHRYTHSEDIKYHDSGNGWMLATVSAWKNSVNATIGGVGMLIGPWALKSLNSIEKIQLRMMVATFNGNPSATIISCYSPTNVSEETKLITFYDELSSLVCSIPKHIIP